MAGKVAIVGTHPRTRDLAPWGDTSYDIWVFNEAPQQEWVKRWSACFQLHKPEVYTSPNNFVRRDHWDWLQQEHGDEQIIYTQEYDHRIPNCREYPLDKITRCIPGAKMRWFKSSPAYAVALALYQGYDTIALYGLDMASNTEYGYQLPNFQFWVGVALGMGVNVENRSNEQYFSGALYAYEGEVQIDRSFFTERAAVLAPELKSRKWAYEKARARLTEALYRNEFMKVTDAIADTADAARDMGEIAGALDSATGYAARPDPIPRQEFERRMAEGQRDAEVSRKGMWIHQGECQYVWNIWKQTGRGDLKQQLETFISRHVQSAEETGIRAGTMRENNEYLNKYDELITAAGGQRTVAALAGVA